MGKNRARPMLPERRPWGRWAALGGLLVVVGAGVGLWWASESREASGGTPRLVVDRTDVDLGYRRFDSVARVAFTLTNAGDGVLRLTETPQVSVKAGC